MPRKIRSKKLQTLKREIAAGKLRLQALWDIYGCTNEEVLAAGIKLDEILNEYQQVKSGVKR